MDTAIGVGCEIQGLFQAPASQTEAMIVLMSAHCDFFSFQSPAPFPTSQSNFASEGVWRRLCLSVITHEGLSLLPRTHAKRHVLWLALAIPVMAGWEAETGWFRPEIQADLQGFRPMRDCVSTRGTTSEVVL